MIRDGVNTWAGWGEFFASFKDCGRPILPEDFDYWSRRMFGRMQGKW